MTGFAIHANEPLCTQVTAVSHHVSETVAVKHTPLLRDAEWFKAELVARGVKGFEIICGDYKEYFYQIPPHLLDAYLALRPLKLHRTALEAVLAQERGKRAHTSE